MRNSLSGFFGWLWNRASRECVVNVICGNAFDLFNLSSHDQVCILPGRCQAIIFLCVTCLWFPSPQSWQWWLSQVFMDKVDLQAELWPVLWLAVWHYPCSVFKGFLTQWGYWIVGILRCHLILHIFSSARANINRKTWFHPGFWEISAKLKYQVPAHSCWNSHKLMLW